MYTSSWSSEMAAPNRWYTFTGAPQNYSWNARCCYFTDPDDNLWELYAWAEGGPVGDLEKAAD